jgi:hypothetical protein
MKKLATVLSILIAAVILTTAAFAGDFIMDTTTRGDWVGKYGSEGYFIPGDTYENSVVKLPAYATVNVTNMFGEEVTACWAFWDETTGAECENDPLAALWIDEAKSARRAACQYDGSALDINIDVGAETKLVSVYINDFDAATAGANRVMDVSLLDKDGNELAFTTLEDSVGGIYLTAEVTGSVTFDIVKVDGPNAVYSGIFFDAVPGAAAAETEAPAVETKPDEAVTVAAPVETETVTTAPQTADVVLLAAVLALVAGGTAISIKKRA